MGLLKRNKEQAPPELPSSTRLRNMPSEDVYLFVETALMTAQHQLSEYRTLPADSKVAALNWILDNVNASSVGVEELLSRNITP